MKTVQVLMSSYNGEKYIKEQIESVLNQKGVNIQLLIRDDGSRDATIDILDIYSQKENVSIIRGHNVGAGRSFAELINKSGDYDYFALCDQDDYWEENKLLSATLNLEKYKEKPCIYSSNTVVSDKCLKPIYVEDKKPVTSLGSAIIKNYVTGCTAVFNNSLREKLRGNIPNSIVCHDWWINLVCLSIGGISVFDNQAYIKYRQHGNNVTGAGVSAIQKWKSRLHRFTTSKYKRDYMANKIIEIYHNDIPETELSILEKISTYKENPLSVIFDKRIRTSKFLDDLLFDICVLVHNI